MTYSGTTAPVKVLFWDIETSPIICTTWGLYPDALQHTDILEDWRIICAAWKWQDSNDVQTAAWKNTTDKKISPFLGKDDSFVIRKLHSVLSQADIVIAHNGDNFDWKKFQARCVQLGLAPPAPKAMIDTLKVVRKEFKLTSNRLDYVGQYLGVGKKLDTPKGLHKDVIWSKPGALKTMLEYNKQDVHLLEAVYNKIKPYIRNHPMIYTSSDKFDNKCPKCGCTDLVKEGFRLTLAGARERFSCKGCGSWMTGRIMARANLKGG